MADRLYRSPTDRVVAGVAGGLAAWLRIDPSIVRVAWVVLAVLSGGIFLLVYFVMMIVVPLPSPGWAPSAAPPPPQGAPWTSPPPSTGPTWNAPDPGNAGIVFGVILVGLGVWLLVDQFVDIDWQLVWPLIVILIGTALIVGTLRRSRPSA